MCVVFVRVDLLLEACVKFVGLSGLRKVEREREKERTNVLHGRC